jgi:hypothetical protein
MLPQRHVPVMPSLGDVWSGGTLADMFAEDEIVRRYVNVGDALSVAYVCIKLRADRVRRFERHFSRTEDTRSFDRQSSRSIQSTRTRSRRIMSHLLQFRCSILRIIRSIH